MRRLIALLPAMLLSLLLMAQQDKTKATGPAPSTDSTKPAAVKKPGITEKVKSSKKAEGLFTLYQDTATGSVQLYVKKGQLDKEYIYQSFSINGPTSLFLNQSMHRMTFVFKIQKFFDRLEVSQVNTDFYYDKDNPISRTKGVDVPDAVILSEKITAEDGLAMSPRRITVSTAGVAKMISQLGDDKVRFKLALSLHAANDTKRDQIMPINETNNLKALIDALNHFYRETKNEITLEYILFNNFNDSNKDADELIKFYRQVPADLVNIIEYNPIDFARFEKPSEERTAQFINYLGKNKVNARLRRSRGKDIDAACGQLANKN